MFIQETTFLSLIDRKNLLATSTSPCIAYALTKESREMGGEEESIDLKRTREW